MKGNVTVISLAILVFSCSTVGVSLRQDQNLSINREVTAKIRAFDRELFKGFDVYRSGVREKPTALLFDLKDEYHLPSRFWGSPLGEEEIIYAIKRVEDQYIEHTDMFFAPRALNIVNKRGQILGYVYTGLLEISMNRKKDGHVTVFPPVTPEPREPKERDTIWKD